MFSFLTQNVNAEFVFFFDTEGCDLTYGNICYTYHSNPLIWQDATDACIALGGHLVDIEDEHENELLRTIGNGKFWI